MEEHEKNSAFIERVNEIMLGIQCCGGFLSKEDIVSKVLRALPPTYKMKVTTINELRTMLNNFVNRDTLVGKISSFELEEFGLPEATKTNNTFKGSTSSTNMQDLRFFYAKELKDMKKEDDKLEQLKALFARRIPKALIGSMKENILSNVLHLIR